MSASDLSFPGMASLGLTSREATDAEGIQTNIGITGVDLLAMVVSDSGLANAEPKWWNASPIGCILIGLQPRGGWQIIQRCVQWGSDGLARSFGVSCESPTLYAYFACTIRNRLEVLYSPRFRSPTVGRKQGEAWLSFEDSDFTVVRPTKLVDGSRGGQAFMAEILQPDGTKHYSIAEQSRLQLLSVLLVGAGLTHEDSLESYVDEVLPLDFDMADGLGSVFRRLLWGLVVASCVCVCFMIATWWSLVRSNLYGSGLPYMVKLISLLNWSVGATGLLMLGGNPRVKLVRKKIPGHIQQRLDSMRYGSSDAEDDEACSTPAAVAKADETHGATVVAALPTPTPQVDQPPGASDSPKPEIHVSEIQVASAPPPPPPPTTVEDTKPPSTRQPPHRPRPNDHIAKIHFGSLHGSIFTSDGGACSLPLPLIETISSLDVSTVRSTGWYVGCAWFGALLLGGLALQIGSTKVPSFGADLLSLGILLATSLARGAGVAGPEAWMIPKWKRREGTSHGARLVGQYSSRTGTEV